MHRRASWRLRPGGFQGQEFGVVGISPLGAEGGEELLWSELTRSCPDVSHRAEEAICEAGRAGDNALAVRYLNKNCRKKGEYRRIRLRWSRVG